MLKPLVGTRTLYSYIHSHAACPIEVVEPNADCTAAVINLIAENDCRPFSRDVSISAVNNSGGPTKLEFQFLYEIMITAIGQDVHLI